MEGEDFITIEIPKKTFIDLFAGTGAFSLVAGENYECVMANDIEKSSEQIYNENFDHNFVLGNLNELLPENVPEHDILCGGFPCQPFSIAGKQDGFNDKRSNVFWKVLEILKSKKPKVVVLENVKNLITHDNKRTFKVITSELTKLGYHIKHKVLDTSKLTPIPHHRERVYIVCFLDESMYNKFVFDFKNVENKTISSYLEKKVDKKYYYTDKLKVYDIVKKSVTKNVNEYNVLYQYRRVYVRENMSNCCPTLTANMGSGGHNVPILLDDEGIRKLTPRECFNLQGFPKSYKLPKLSDSKLYKLAGNAVSVPIVALIFNKISEILP